METTPRTQRKYNTNAPESLSPEQTAAAKKKKQLSSSFRYGRREHDRDMSEAKLLLGWVVKPLARLALRAKTYNGREDIGTYEKQQYVERLWKRFVKRKVRSPYV